MCSTLGLEDAYFSFSYSFPLEGRGTIVTMTKDFFGVPGVVRGHTSDGKVKVKLSVPPPEPPFGFNIAKSMRVKGVNEATAAASLGISVDVLRLLA